MSKEGKMIDFASHPVALRNQAERQEAQDAWNDPEMRKALIKGYNLDPNATFEDCLNGVRKWIDGEMLKIQWEMNTGVGILFDDST